MLSRLSTRRFGLYSLFGLLSPNAAGLKVATYPPARAVPEHTPIEKVDEPHKLQVTALDNGVRILSESTDFPSAVTVGVSIGTGTRDEDMDHAGICMALKNTFLKTNTRTNEQLNYCMIQMGGGNFCMKYNQEHLFYIGQFLAHDTYDFLQLTADVVLDDKTYLDEEAAHWRADEYFKLRDLYKTHHTVIEDQWLTTAYGLKDLGMPLAGFQSKFQNIGYSHLNHFREHNATPDRMIVMGAGINNHEEFVDAVKPYFQHINPAKAHARPQAKYLGGEIRCLSEETKSTIHLSFQGPSYTANATDYAAFVLLKSVIGESCSKSAPSIARAYTHFIQKYPFISCITQNSATFSDSSNWGLNVSGASESAGKIADALTTELLDLTKISEQELTRAKLHYLACLTSEFQCPGFRLNSYANGLQIRGQPTTLPLIFEKTNAVTVEQFRTVVANLLKTRPTLIVQGGNSHEVPSLDKLQARLK